MKIKKYRIVKDNYAGYEVQCWRLWFPFWLECWNNLDCNCNTHFSIEQAEKFIKRKQNKKYY